jgi:hypothetical protein
MSGPRTAGDDALTAARGRVEAKRQLLAFAWAYTPAERAEMRAALERTERELEMLTKRQAARPARARKQTDSDTEETRHE